LTTLPHYRKKLGDVVLDQSSANAMAVRYLLPRPGLSKTPPEKAAAWIVPRRPSDTFTWRVVLQDLPSPPN